MKPKFFWILCILFSSLVSSAQTFPFLNWIDPSQEYIKIPVGETGIYRLTYQTLLNNGFNINANPQNFQLWKRGKQVPLRILNSNFQDASSDGFFSDGEFLEFYGQKNDGTLDKDLTENALNLTHPQVSMYNDTSYYFLTNSSTGPYLRYMDKNSSVNPSNLGSEVITHRFQLDTNFVQEYNYYKIDRESNKIAKSSWLQPGEGYVSKELGNNHIFCTIATKQFDGTLAQSVPLRIRFVPLGTNGNSRVLIRLSSSNGTTLDLDTVKISGPNYIDRTFNIQKPNLFSGNFLNISIHKIIGTDISISSLHLEFQEIISANYTSTKKFNLENSTDTNQFFKLSTPNFPFEILSIRSGISSPDIYKVTSSGSFTFVIKKYTDRDTVLLRNKNKFLTISNLKKVIFNIPNVNDFNYYIVTHPSLASSVANYEAYRKSPLGGSFSIKTFFIEELYEHFSYGEKTPVAIRNLSRFLSTRSIKPYLFLLGRGISQASFSNETGVTIFHRITKIPSLNEIDLLPTFGFPVSEVLLTSGLNPSLAPLFDGRYLEPVIPFARLNAYTNTQVLNYLNKVKQHETGLGLADQSQQWRKNNLFLSGGKNDGERSIFKGYVSSLSNITKGPLIGSRSVIKGKSSPGISLEGTNVNIVSEVNSGISLLYSLGHTAPNIFDVNYGRVSDPTNGYLNLGKYPLQYVCGCQSGDAFFERSNLADDWIFTDQKGSILYLGNTDIGFASTLNNYAARFLKNMYQDTSLVNKPISAVWKKTNKDFMVGNSNNSYYEANMALTMILFGDPAIKMFPYSLPDFYTSSTQISMTGKANKKPSILSDTLLLKVRVFNLGRYQLKDSIKINVVRKLNNGSSFTYPIFRFAALPRDSVYTLKLYNQGFDNVGLQSFDVCINSDQKVKESDYSNDCGSLEYNFASNSILCVLPQEFSVVSQNQVKFIANVNTSTVSQARNFEFELDTSYLFNSQVKQSATVTAKNIIEIKKSIFNAFSPKDSTVFYWRIRFQNPPSNTDSAWSTSSFVYIANSQPGWSQSQFPQFLKNNFYNIQVDEAQRNYAFIANNNRLNFTLLGAGSNLYTQKVLLNSVNIFFPGYCPSQTNGMIAISMRGQSLDRYFSPFLNFCSFLPEAVFTDNLIDANAQNNLIQYLDYIPNGDFIILMNTGNAHFESWGSGLKNKMSALGASKFLKMKDNWPYGVIFKKGTGVVAEIIPDTTRNDEASQILRADIDLVSGGNNGSMYSTTIGPATAWKDLQYSFKPMSTGDAFYLNIFGKKSINGTAALVYKGKPSSGTLLNDLGINANTYPYLELESFVKDSILITAPQLKKWQILYDGVPEGILSSLDAQFTDSGFVQNKTYQTGEEVVFKFEFSNVSNLDFRDSLLLTRIKISNTTNASIYLDSLYFPAPKKGSKTTWSYRFKTGNLAGNNTLQFYTNPEISPEQNYLNNIITVPALVISKDNKNPLLNVTIDGQKVTEGEIISPNPVVVMTVTDENKFLNKTDTSGISILWKKAQCPNGNCGYERINLQNPAVQIQRTTGKAGQYMVSYQPKNLEDGIHCLQVQMSDASGNNSGVRPYEICFEVVNQSSITQILPYPNPFSTGTQFVFTLTGAVIPDQMKIQIMTVSGKIVREITQDEIGPLRIGYNISKYVWNGTDEFGDKLANGVYFYKVSIRSQGQDISKRSTSVDAFFEKNIGKMYILR